MVQFEYEAELDDSSLGNTKFGFSGTQDANSIYHVRDMCLSAMVIQGKYKLRIRNVKEGRWVNFGPVTIGPDGPEPKPKQALRKKPKEKGVR